MKDNAIQKGEPNNMLPVTKGLVNFYKKKPKPQNKIICSAILFIKTSTIRLGNVA